jgi:hypothetical protein
MTDKSDAKMVRCKYLDWFFGYEPIVFWEVMRSPEVRAHVAGCQSCRTGGYGLAALAAAGGSR